MAIGGPSISGYRIGRLLSAGPRGESYLAARGGGGRRQRWVLKRLALLCGTSLGDSLRADFLDLASLSHDSLALPSSLWLDQEAGQANLARPYLEGSDLPSMVQKMTPRQILPWLEAGAEALAVLHRFGFAHRNLKGANFLVPRTSGLPNRRRHPAVILCDPAWWPEGSDHGGRPQAPGSGIKEQGTRASDLRSLGSLFYLFLTGSATGLSGPGRVRPPTELNREIPIDLERLVLKLLHPDRGLCYPDIDSLLEDLRRLQASRRGTAGGASAAGSFGHQAPECFFGRSGELERALLLLRDPRRPAAIAIGGESGIGKSALLRRLELESQLRGYRTAAARCYPGSVAPIAPVRALIDQLLPFSAEPRSVKERFGRLLGEPSGREDVDGSPPGGEARRAQGFLELLGQLSGRQPTLLLLDDVHLADPSSLSLLGMLVEEVSDSGGRAASGEPSPPSVVLTFRSEASFLIALETFLSWWKSPAPNVALLELPQLSREAVKRWLEGALGRNRRTRERVKADALLSGHPFTIREAIRSAAGAAGEKTAPNQDLASFHQSYLASLDPVQRDLLRVLSVLGRPAPLDLLAALSAAPAVLPRPAVAFLIRQGTLSEKDGRLYFRHESFRAWLLDAQAPGERKALHHRIAAALERLPEPAVEEIACHWLQSDSPRKGTRAALEAAPRLVRAREHRRAINLYRSVLDLLPVSRARLRKAIAVDLAEAHARSGDPRRGAGILEDLLAGAGSDGEAGVLHGRLGVFLHRAGELAQAIPHLKQALALLDGARGENLRLQALRCASELAEILCNRGDYAEAERICLGGLGRGSVGRAGGDVRVRREEMILIETLAHLKLRRLDHREARELFERSLRISEELSAGPEKGLILNNLGIVHLQENRFPEAITCFLKARKLSEARGEPGVLVNIESNLAMLLARIGKPEEADEALAKAAQREVRCSSDRIRFLRLHGAGVVNLLLGRYPAAIEALKEALQLGQKLGDLSMVAFGCVYLGECHLFQGETGAARAAFSRALSFQPSAPLPVKSMVTVRQLALAALGGDRRRARAALAVQLQGSEREIPYLEAWNRIFLGWAHRLLGRLGEAEDALEKARGFFAKAKVPVGEIHAHLELAAVEMEGGETARARERLESLRSRHPLGQGALKNPMLSARLLAYQARVFIEGDPSGVEAAVSLLAEAENCLIGRRLRDLEKLVRSLKKRVAPRDRQGCAPAAGSAKDFLREEGPASPGSTSRASSILGTAASIKKVRSQILQVAPTRLAVLITGETGTGKELVARAIHGESPRSQGPLLSVNCAALPGELLEAELFGYRRGAFSGADQDRTGLLPGADGGSFLFDALGDLPLSLQAKLLRVLDRGAVRPLGASEEVEVDVRFLFASNRELRSLVNEGRFRQDLFYRLSTFEIRLPPLRERVGDVPLLLSHFQEQAKGERQTFRFDPGALEFLVSYPWPGNVRELENLVRRLALTAEGKIGAEEVRGLLSGARAAGPFPPEVLRGSTLPELQDLLERSYLIQLHADCGGDLRAMARALGIKRRALYKRFTRLGIKPGDLEGR